MNETVETTCPKPGIYRDVDFNDYLKWDALSNSRIKVATESLLHFKEAGPVKETNSMRLGTFLHCGILEPEAIGNRYAVMPPYELDAENVTKDGKPSKATTTEYYKAKRYEFERVNEKKLIVTQSDYDMLTIIAKRMRDNERCVEWMARAETEVSIVWEDDDTGLMCKARLDVISSIIADLKSCQSVKKFPSSIANYGYHRQAAHYRNGWGKLTGDVLPVGFIAVETSHPFPVNAALMSEEAIEVGSDETTATLRAIADAYESGEWSGPSEPDKWCLPHWYSSDGGDEVELVIGGQKLSI